MNLKIIKGGNEKNININNSIILNKASFTILKLSLSAYYPPVMKLNYDEIRPILIELYEYSTSHPEFNLVEVDSKDGSRIYVSC